jgi:hypothetical protein
MKRSRGSRVVRFGDILGEWGLPRCRCGEEVASPHQSCLMLMTPAEQDEWLGRDEEGGM